MSQTPAIYKHVGDEVNYTPASTAVNGGDVLVFGSRVYVAPTDIAVGQVGALASRGVFYVPKDGSSFAAGDAVYWNPTGSPTVGTAGTGCATSTRQGAVLMGLVTPAGAAAAGAANVEVSLGVATGNNRESTETVAAAGTTQATATPVFDGLSWVTGANAAAGVILPTAIPGMQCEIKNDDAANAILLVYPATGAKINAAAANAAFSMPAKSSCRLIAYSATQWFSIPLLPS